MDLNDKSFKAVENMSGLSSSETIFTYKQNGDSILGSYSGGKVEFGNIVGRQIGTCNIELLFQCKTTSGELLSGQSAGRVHLDNNGKLEITFDWSWLYGTQGSGISTHKEI